MAKTKDEGEKWMKDNNTCIIYDTINKGYLYKDGNKYSTSKNRELAQVFTKIKYAQSLIKKMAPSRQLDMEIENYYLFDVLHIRNRSTGKWVLALNPLEKNKLFHVAA